RAELIRIILELQKDNEAQPVDQQELMKFIVAILQQELKQSNTVDPEEREKLLRVNPAAFGPSLANVAAMLFAISGYTMWLSASARFRWRVMGLAVLVTLIQFLVNLLGQLWETMEWLRPCTVFYYYQPQEIILHNNWMINLGQVWNGGRPL